MINLSTQSKWKPWMAVIIEAIVIASLWFIGGPMQEAWGLWGLIATELMFLAIAVIVVLIYKTPFKEVFPIKAPSAREVFGIIVFAIAGMLANLILLGISMLFLGDVSTELGAMNDFMYVGTNRILLFIALCIAPAICEEAIHRGVILSHLRSLKKDWGVVLVMGLFFGLFHLSPLRFLSTAFLGMLITYVMVKKNNFVLAMLFHFTNNLMSNLMGIMSNNSSAASGTDAIELFNSINKVQIFGAYLVLGFLAPILLVVANLLVYKEGHKNSYWIVAGVLSAILLVAGFVIVGTTVAATM